MSEWKEYKFSDTLIDESISYGVVQPGFKVSNGVPIIRVNNIRNGTIEVDDILKIDAAIESKYQRTRLRGGELLITVVGTLGECAIVPNSLKGWNVARAVSVARIKPYFDVKFIKYCFQLEEIKHQLYGSMNDTVQPTLNLSSLKEITLKIPAQSIQQKIAGVINSFDDKIDLLTRQNKTLEQLAETYFRQWFVEEAEDSWEKATLEKIATFHNGKERPKDEGDIPIYGGNGILGYANKSNYNGKCIIIGRVGAYCGSLYYENKEIWLSDNALLAKPKLENSTHYLFYLLKSMDINSMAEGSSHPLITQTLLKSIEVILPPTEKIIVFENQSEQLREKTRANQVQIRTLTHLRDTLLPKLMSGEVSLK